MSPSERSKAESLEREVRRMPSPPSRALLAELYRSPRARSRNRNFGRFRDDPSYARAARLVRSLRALRADLIRFRGRAQVSVASTGDDGRTRLTVVVPALRLRRTVHLWEHELELLRQDPDLSDLLATPMASRCRRS